MYIQCDTALCNTIDIYIQCDTTAILLCNCPFVGLFVSRVEKELLSTVDTTALLLYYQLAWVGIPTLPCYISKVMTSAT